MKYSELERILKKSGCYDTGEVHAGHPLWINPKTWSKVLCESSSLTGGSIRNLEKYFEGSRYKVTELQYEKGICNNRKSK